MNFLFASKFGIAGAILEILRSFYSVELVCERDPDCRMTRHWLAVVDRQSDIPVGFCDAVLAIARQQKFPPAGKTQFLLRKETLLGFTLSPIDQALAETAPNGSIQRLVFNHDFKFMIVCGAEPLEDKEQSRQLGLDGPLASLDDSLIGHEQSVRSMLPSRTLPRRA